MTISYLLHQHKNEVKFLKNVELTGVHKAGSKEGVADEGYIQGDKVVEERRYQKQKKRKVKEKERRMSLRIEKAAAGNEAEPQVKRRKMEKVEVDEIMDEDLDENTKAGDDVGKDDEGDKGEKDKDIESNIAEHVTTCGMTSNVNVNVNMTDNSRVGEYQAEEQIPEKEVYDTPKTVAHGECADYSRVSEYGKMEGDVENESGIGNVTSSVLDKGKNILSDLDNADEVDEDDGKGKRRVEVSKPLTSPFVKRAVSISIYQKG
ncbi:hypothetical protein L1887_41894 [Cichorium endivia]|nr:hypothetical protein L1887_41894 [Cichorium endivia]